MAPSEHVSASVLMRRELRDAILDFATERKLLWHEAVALLLQEGLAQTRTKVTDTVGDAVELRQRVEA